MSDTTEPMEVEQQQAAGAKPKRAARKAKAPEGEAAAAEVAPVSGEEKPKKERKSKKAADVDPAAACVTDDSKPVAEKKSRKRKGSDATASGSSSDSLSGSSDSGSGIGGGVGAPNVSDSAPGADSTASADAKKRRTAAASTDADQDQLNKTMDTQINLEHPGVAASKAPTLGTYLRCQPQQREMFDHCLQKPKGVRKCDWDAVPADQRTLWVVYHKNLKDVGLTAEQFSFEKCLRYVREQEGKLCEAQNEFAQDIHEREQKNTSKLNKQSRLIDRHLITEMERIRDLDAEVAAQLKARGL